MDLQQAKLHLETSKLMGVDFLPVAEQTSPVSTTDAQTLLTELSQKHDQSCPHCTSVTGYTQTVFGVGNPTASLMFIGEAPGAEEDLIGVPFVGDAGKKLDDIISAMNMHRDDVYIANVLKSRPPNNRTPTPKEIQNCAPFLVQQIAIVQPTVIVALGSPAAKFLLQTSKDITQLRGSWATFDGICVMPTFHPAYLLRNYTDEIRSQIWSDMQQVMEKLSQ